MHCCNTVYWVLAVALLSAASLVVTGMSSSQPLVDSLDMEEVRLTDVSELNDEKSIATFGGGCFWCVEAVFQELDGVSEVTSGYMGGRVKNPTYAQVSRGTTGHAEVCQITYDPQKVSFQKLLEVFFATHDPTTLNRQGNDFGTQYRSVIFFHDEEQQQVAETIKEKLDESGAYKKPIVTEVTAASEYYLAEDYHQDYFSLNPRQQYCRSVIVPKMRKFRKVFEEDLKSR